jgi:hypothetical protein
VFCGHASFGVTGTDTGADRLTLWFGHAEQRLAVLALHKLAAHFIRNREDFSAAKIWTDQLAGHDRNLS